MGFHSEPAVGSVDWAVGNTALSTINELLSGPVSSYSFHAVLSQHFTQPRRDSATSIALRSSVRTPPGCRQTRVGDEVDTRSQRYFAGESTLSTQGQTCSGVPLQMIIWMLDGATLLLLLLRLPPFLETLRNECPQGASKLLRCWMIVGVLKRLQTMSVTETGVMCAWTIFKSIRPRNLHFCFMFLFFLASMTAWDAHRCCGLF